MSDLPQPSTEPVEPDVVVIGGGPAGSTAATLLARRGWRVALFEKARHPRFHIGESLLPKNLPILERLGVLEQVRAIGVRKIAADFPLDATRHNSFRFSRALDACGDSAFQVRRDQFDRLLFEHARASGVEAFEGVEVTAVDWDAAGRATVTTVTTDDADGRRQWRPRYVVDASGRDTLLGSRMKLKRRDAQHQSAAIFSHYRGVVRRDGEEAGNITVQRFEHGWVWLIPLPDDVMSVGAVCFPEYLKQRRGDSEGFLQRTLMAIPEVAARMQQAERVADVHVTGNYSYACRDVGGHGWLLIGDAYAFIDPIFSSGVYLAMDSAEQAANVVDQALREPARERALQRAMQRRLRRGLSVFSWFIYRFNSPAMGRLFRNPRNHLQLEQAVIAMLAGDVFDNRRVRHRLYLFRLVYLATAAAIGPRALVDRWRRRRQAGVSFGDETLHRGTGTPR